MNENIMVSIICNTYNQEDYVRDAIESFLMQKTDFPFEVLIHDDASTDKTPQIIKEYEEKYPDIIKPIYQKENQYSQGISCSAVYQFPRVKGKYIAFCEGDDYWTDSYKLQKQYDAMEQHLEVDICAHKGLRIVADTKKEICATPNRKTSIIPVEQIIKGIGEYLLTNSLFYRSHINKEVPRFRKYMFMDYTLQIHGALRGGLLFLEDIMSAYRVSAKGSWSVRMRQNTVQWLEHYEKKKQTLLLLDEDTNYKYTQDIQERIRRDNFNALEISGKYKEMLSLKNRNIYKELSVKRRLKIRIKAYFPFLIKFKRKLGRKNN